MKNISKLFAVIITVMLVITGCSGLDTPGEEGQEILQAGDVLDSTGEEDTVLVDARSADDYEKSHVEGAVNIGMNDVTSFGPFPNMLAPGDEVGEVLGEKGIEKDSTVIVYDDNDNMDAARFWWTLKVYGHEDVRVVSGGWKAMQKEDADETDAVPEVEAVEYEVDDKNEDIIATKEEVKEQVDNPSDDVVLLDTRTSEEYNEGTIPGSVHYNYENNNFDDGTYRPVRQIHTLYKDLDITPDKTIIMYCKTSVRAAQTYVALYNAGYRDLKIYDGAWSEWSSDDSLPVETPDGSDVEANVQDSS